MSVSIRVLVIEDSEPDAELLIRELQDGGYDPEYEIVETPEAMSAALDNKPWDAIIADYVMPRFSGLDALRMVQERGLDIPIVMVSGKIGDDVAADTMLAGAKDYVLKSNLTRLAPAVKREITDTRRRQRAEGARRQAEEALRRAYDEQEQRIVERTEELLEANWLLSKEITERKNVEDALRQSQALLQSIIDSSNAAVYIKDSEGRFIMVNDASAAFLGTTKEEAVGKTDHDLLPREAADRYCADDRAIIEAGIPCQFEETVRKDDGVHTYISAKFPIRDTDGDVFAVGGISTDITKEKRIQEALDAQRRRAEALEIIAEAGIATTDMQELLEILTHRIAEILDVYSCCIFMLDEDSGEFVAHAACGIPELAGSRLKADEGPAGIVYRERRPVYVEYTEKGPRMFHEALKKHGIQGVLKVPLVTSDKVVGLARIDMLSPRTFTEEEMGMIEAMAARAAQAIDNIRIYEALTESRDELREALDREHYYSQLLQKTLLPETPFIGSGYSAGVKYIPAYAGQEVGGDFYDVFNVGESRAGVVIGDVAGKGLGAAALAATTRSTIHAFVHETASAGEALTRANAVISSHQLASESFVTVSLFIVDLVSGNLTYASAGHPPAGILRKDGDVEFIEVAQLPLAMLPDHNYPEFHNHLNPGDKLILYTDGILEARSDSQLFDFDGIKRVLKDHGDLPADDLADKLLSAASQFAGGRFKDDAAIAIIERL